MNIEQRIGRVDRIGQEKDVIAINFVLSDTIEEYVREKIETKLEIIKEQFGEDKLRDILSTLDEEFRFDKLYIDYLIKYKTDKTDIDKVSEEIYQKTKKILENDEILIPFSEITEMKNLEIESLRNISKKIRTYTSLFLQNKNTVLNEYKDKSGLFYFQNSFRTDILPTHYAKIIFEQNKGMEIEDAELFSFMHPFTRESIQYTKNNGKCSSFIIEDKKFSGTTGYLFNWIFTVTNNFNLFRQYVIPIFMTDDGQHNRRISDYLRNIDEATLIDSKEKIDSNLNDLNNQITNYVKETAESIFWDIEKNWKEKIELDMKKMEKYYYQKAKAIEQIKIDNIQQSKQNELRREKTQKILELKKHSQLFPSIECIQIARIKFS
jgi:hypothetical protein